MQHRPYASLIVGGSTCRNREIREGGEGGEISGKYVIEDLSRSKSIGTAQAGSLSDMRQRCAETRPES